VKAVNDITLGSDAMIYVCAKCKFLFERKNEPSKCPSCENQCVMEANKNERQAFQDLHGSQKRAIDHLIQLPTDNGKS